MKELRAQQPEPEKGEGKGKKKRRGGRGGPPMGSRDSGRR